MRVVFPSTQAAAAARFAAEYLHAQHQPGGAEATAGAEAGAGAEAEAEAGAEAEAEAEAERVGFWARRCSA